MTDSAGTPAEPDNPDNAAQPTGAPGADGDDVADGTSEDSAGTAEEPSARDTPRDDGDDEPAVPADRAEPAAPSAAHAPVTVEVNDALADDGTAAAHRRAAPPADDGPAAAAENTGTPDSTDVDATSDTTTGPSGTGRAAASGADGEQPRRKRHLLRWFAVGTSVVVLAAAGAGWWFYQKLDGNITTDTMAAAELKTYEKERPTPVALDAENILLIGSDTRSGQGNDVYGPQDSGSRSDTTMLLHLAADRHSATAMSIPRDLMVDIPACRSPDGTSSRAQFAQFNWAYQFGGTACTIRTVEKLTRVRVDHYMVIDFRGFKGMVNAVGGVDVCLKEPVDDEQAHLELPAGRQKLNGEQALGFVRARHGIGDGSDTQRMDRQQRFLGALFKKVQSNGVLLNPTRLYPVLDAATKSITTDPGLDSLKDLYDVAGSLRDVPAEQVRFLTVPRQPYTYDRNRDELVQPEADTLFEQLREDKAVSVSPSGQDDDFSADGSAGRNTPVGGNASRGEKRPDLTNSASPAPPGKFTGTNAAAGMCG